MLREFALPFDLARFSLQSPLLLTAPRGDGRPVLLLPGYMASDRSMRPLRRFLTLLGYNAYDWELGRNQGNPLQLAERAMPQIERLQKSNDGKPVTLIGWSLGGIVARLLASEVPESVREVITIASPIVGGPKYTSMARRFAGGADLDEIEARIDRRNRQLLTQPITAIYSDVDGIVGRNTARDDYNAQARNIRVDESHIGLGYSPRVWRIIADTLAGKKDQGK